MKRLTFPNREALSRAAAEHVVSIATNKPKASFCLATGGTPERVYELVVELNKTGTNRFSSARMIKLDEWGGLHDEHPATCEHYLQERLLKPLNIHGEQFLSFKTQAKDRDAECARVQSELDQIGQIDLCILGLGANGHLGFNEPADSLTPNVHVASLTEQTQQHPMVRSTDEKPTFGFTLGIADLLKSREIILLVSGAHKTGQLKRLLTPNIDTKFPASFLWLHPNTTIYSDIE